MKQTAGQTTVALDFLGCKLNQAEIQELGRELAGAGYRLVEPDGKADIYVLNTCTVTRTADRKSRQMLRAARRRNPSARLIAIGCYADRAGDELAGIEGVELVLGNDRKRRLAELLGKPENDETAVSTAAGGPGGRTRSFLRVQDGCRYACAYCIVPKVRSRVESVPAERVLTMVNGQVSAGYREIVLTGTEIGIYADNGNDLETLLERILAETGIERLRISSLQPPEISQGLLGLWRDSRLCPHFHLSLQSGSDSVLKRMKRRYDTEHYRQAVALIRELAPDAAVTTDIIVGFPGETEAEFGESYTFCRDTGFARIHVFPYSPRPGTAAVDMPEKVPENVKKERSRRMLALGKKSATVFREGFSGRTMEVLFEQQSGGLWNGLTGNYIKVYVESGRDLTNEIVPVRLEKNYRDGLTGELV